MNRLCEKLMLWVVIPVVIIFCSAVLLAGCAIFVDEHRPPPDGWPTLKVQDNVVSGWEVIRRCSKYTAWYVWPPMACVEVNFEASTCDIWRTWDAQDGFVEHESLHCRGYSHYGETWAADALRLWRASVAGSALGKAAQ